MSRFRAAAFHLALSVLVGAILLSLFWFIWYPFPLFAALGGKEIFLMLLGIDVVLGPLSTLVVFKSGKKSLKSDLAVIGAVQIAALMYGVFTLLHGRPVYIAAVGHRFDLIQASEIGDEQAAPIPAPLPFWGPRWVGVKQPTDKGERERMMMAGLAGVDVGHFPQYHAPLDAMREEILKNAKPIANLRMLNAAHDVDITAWLRAHGQTDDGVVFQGLKARAEDMAVILDAKTAKVIGIAPFKPWD